MTGTQSITGTFLEAGQTEAFGVNNFLVRKFLIDITENPAYPNTPEFQLTGDKVNLVDNLVKGQTVTVKYGLQGRKYENLQTGKKGVITSLNAWRIEVVQTTSAAVAPRPAPGQPGSTRPTPSVAPPAAPTNPFGFSQDAGEEDKDLPF